MIPKLYLIESKKQDGVVKIGSAGTGEQEQEDPVFKRVDSYKTGISDSSVVHEIPGAQVFERYLHQFVKSSRREVTIEFLWKGKKLNPREWFELPTDVLSMFIDAFSREHPQQIEQVSSEHLPIFLSGALSAIRWHAENANPAELAEFAAGEALRKKLEEYQEQIEISQPFPTPLVQQSQQLRQVSRDRDGEYQQQRSSTPLTQQKRQLNEVSRDTDGKYQQPRIETQPQLSQQNQQSGRMSEGTDSIKSMFDAVGREAALKIEMKEMREMESSRTIIAIVAAIMVCFLLVTGAAIAGCLFAICASGLYASWPTVQPSAASALVRLSEKLKRSAKKSRHRASQNKSSK